MSDERRDVEHQFMAAAGPSNGPPLPRIFQMNIDCFDELFEWLSVRELLVLRQTCKRFKALADYYIRTFYPAVKWGCAKIRDDIHSNIDQFYRLDPNHAKLIKNITLSTGKLEWYQINGLKQILSHAEVLRMISNQIKSEFYASFLQFCPNLKKLITIIVAEDRIMGSDNKWLLRKYPKLEHVEFKSLFGSFTLEIPEVKTFFELNPNIRTFSTTIRFLVGNARCFIGSNIKFDVLSIKGCCFELNIDNFCALVSQLYEQGFYNRLHVFSKHEVWKQIATLPAIETLRLHLANDGIPIDLSPSMTGLKYLRLDVPLNDRHFGNSNVPPGNLMNIECLSIGRTSLINPLPFIRHSAGLKEIHVSQFNNIHDGVYLKNGIVDVEALNKVREQLIGACKQTIYVDEKIFMATKWAGKPTKCALVELKRKQSCKWKDIFYV